MMTLTATLKRSITSDWNKCFEGLGIYKPMWLGRLVGPFFQGICLERSSGNTSYLPTSHIHCLCRDFPVVSLTLGQRLLSPRSRTEQSIPARFHELQFAEAADRLNRASLLPLAGSWGLRDLIFAVEAYQTLEQADSKYPVFLFEDVVMAAAWLGDNDQATVALANFESITSTWPESIMARYGGWRSWGDNLRRLIDDPKTLREATNSHIEKLRVSRLGRIEMLA